MLEQAPSIVNSYTALSLGAGLLVCCSSFPALFDAFRSANIDSWFQVVRNLFGATGNAAWMSYGLLTWQPAIIVFCGTTFILLSLLVVLQVLRIFQPLTNKGTT